MIRYTYDGDVVVKQRMQRPSVMFEVLLEGLKNPRRFGIQFERTEHALLYDNKHGEFYGNCAGVALASFCNVNYDKIRNVLYRKNILNKELRDLKYTFPNELDRKATDFKETPFGVYQIHTETLRLMPLFEKKIPSQLGLTINGEVKYSLDFDACETAFDEFLEYFNAMGDSTNNGWKEPFFFFDLCNKDIEEAGIEPPRLHWSFNSRSISSYDNILEAMKDGTWRKGIVPMEVYGKYLKSVGY